MDYLAGVRKVVTPTGAQQTKKIDMHKLHNTHYGYLCVTGDTLITLSDGITQVPIKELDKDATIMTVNRTTYELEPSKFYNYFE
ncbi:MAG: hypothetical protein EB127_31840, partial [Alphaproteobacteria bacterium]|nr:hypothetical protein [Alphaproteobacteria bacterium]